MTTPRKHPTKRIPTTPEDDAATAAAAGAATVTPTPTLRQPRDRQAIIGIQRNLKGVGTITLMGKDYTPETLSSIFQKRVDAADTTDNSEHAWHENVATERALEQSVAPIRKAFSAYLTSRYGAKSKTLGQFGVAPPRNRRKPSSATRAEAVKKSEATRAARMTMGKRQKEKVKAPTAATPDPAVAASNAPEAPVVKDATNGTATPTSN